MSDLLILGMEMPKDEGDSIHILRDGTAVIYRDESIDFYKAVLVQTHGRLIDADAFGSIKYELPNGQKAFNRGFHSGVQYVQRLIMDAPTIIPAEEAQP